MELKDASVDDIVEELYQRKKKDFNLKITFYDSTRGTYSQPRVSIDVLTTTPKLQEIWSEIAFNRCDRLGPGTRSPIW